MNLNVDPGYFRNLKTRRLTGLLGKGSEVLPLKLWAHCAEHHAEDGELTGYSAQEVEACIEWWGKPGAAVEGMLKVGFIAQTDDGFRVHDWLTYQGHISAFKERARTAAHAKWEQVRRAAAELDASRNASSACSSAPSNALASQPANPPVHTEPTSPDEDVGGGGVARNGRREALAAALRAAGVKAPGKVKACCDVPGLTPVAVVMEARELRAKKEKVRDVGAVLPSRLLAEGYVPPTLLLPADVCTLVNQGLVESVAGVAIRGDVKHNRSGLYIDASSDAPVVVQPADLKPESIVLRNGHGQGH